MAEWTPQAGKAYAEQMRKKTEAKLAKPAPKPVPTTRPYTGQRRKACITGGQCSSFGSGRHCGGYGCDGY